MDQFILVFWSTTIKVLNSNFNCRVLIEHPKDRSPEEGVNLLQDNRFGATQKYPQK